MNDKRAEVEVCIATLVQLIDEHSELDDLCALLCAVGAACNDKVLATTLLAAIEPIMMASYVAMIAKNN